MLTSDFDYILPPELIAQSPLPGRSDSRMLVVCRGSGRLEHRRVTDLPAFLRAGDLLVVNNTRVFPARLFGRRGDSGGRVELLLLEEEADGAWTAMFKASGRPRAGMRLELAGGLLEGEVLEALGQGRVRVRLGCEGNLFEMLERAGTMPLPPYIRRAEAGDGRAPLDRARYQTVYAREVGAVAAPTAGLHFSPALFEALERAGVGRAEITLHVGPGTFKPVKAESVAEHVMEAERYVVSEAAAAAVRETKAAGGRIVAVGSTTVRTLETVAREHGEVRAGCGRSALFIHPPFDFKAVDLMLTNFHLPRSTLLMMVAALAGRELILRAYAEAVAECYRFYSYGDCMLIAP